VEKPAVKCRATKLDIQPFENLQLESLKCSKLKGWLVHELKRIGSSHWTKLMSAAVGSGNSRGIYKNK